MSNTTPPCPACGGPRENTHGGFLRCYSCEPDPNLDPEGFAEAVKRAAERCTDNIHLGATVRSMVRTAAAEVDPMAKEDHDKVRANIKRAGVIRQHGTRWPTATSVVDDDG